MSRFIFRKKYLLTLLSLSITVTQARTLPPIPDNLTPHPPYHVMPHSVDMATPGGFSPAQIRQAYGIPSTYQGAGTTIAIIDSGDDPNIESDLNTFSAQFGLPACTTANGCFTKLFSDGALPPADSGWAVETSLDVEWAHAIAPQAKIILIESQDAYSLYNAVPFAIAQKPSVISISWGGGEFNGETYYDSLFQPSKTPIVACTGDGGHGVWYPAASPYVVAAGGTQLALDANGNYSSETGWSGSGGGVSAYEPQPAFQKTYVIPQANGMRGVPDVSWDASGGSPFAVYDSYQQGGWLMVAGTSAAAPQWAALIAIMESAKNGTFANFNATIYSVARQTTPVLLHDILTGNNGSCGYFCQSRSGYDYVTGLGTPQAAALINRFK